MYPPATFKTKRSTSLSTRPAISNANVPLLPPLLKLATGFGFIPQLPQMFPIELISPIMLPIFRLYLLFRIHSSMERIQMYSSYMMFC